MAFLFLEKLGKKGLSHQVTCLHTNYSLLQIVGWLLASSSLLLIPLSQPGRTLLLSTHIIQKVLPIMSSVFPYRCFSSFLDDLGLN